MEEMPTFLVSLGAFCQQGNQYHTSSISIRILIIFIQISGLLAYNFYTSIVVSSTIQTKYDSTIRTAKDLANSSMSIGFANTSVYRHWIKYGQNDDDLEIFKNK